MVQKDGFAIAVTMILNRPISCTTKLFPTSTAPPVSVGWEDRPEGLLWSLLLVGSCLAYLGISPVFFLLIFPFLQFLRRGQKLHRLLPLLQHTATVFAGQPRGYPGSSDFVCCPYNRCHQRVISKHTAPDSYEKKLR